MDSQFHLVIFFLTAVTLALPCSGLRDVRLELPPVVRAGGSATLRCLYDLEGMPLYSVKWYRGNFEFFRVMPKEYPARQAFAYPDIHVDLSESNEEQVTLRRVPLLMSGTFSCEVSTDVAFTTAFVSGQLQVLDTVRRPLVTVSKNLYSPGDELEVNCTVSEAEGRAILAPPPRSAVDSPPLQPHQLSPEQRAHLRKDNKPPASFAFWINNVPVRKQLVQQTSGSSAMLRRELSERDFSESGELHIKCVVTLAGLYREPSHIVTVRRADDADALPDDPDLDVDVDADLDIDAELETDAKSDVEEDVGPQRQESRLPLEDGGSAPSAGCAATTVPGEAGLILGASVWLVIQYLLSAASRSH